jgi:pilus assembly protein CpaE
MIRVVVVDDSAEIVSNIERMLFFEPDIEIIGTANDGETGLQLVRDTKPDVVLLDINMPGMDGLTTAQAITSTIPGTQVIMMSVQDDLDYLRRAMLAGARDYILKPLDIDEVSNKVRQVHGLNRGKTNQAAPEEQEERGRIVTVFGPRGGCGCSTVAVNLALALREFTRRKVVIVDASLQFGDVAVLLNLHDGRSIADLARRVDEVDANFASEMTLPHMSGVRALLAPPRPEGAELVTGEAMHRILDALRQAFDFVVVDAGHSVGDAVLAAIDETDELLLMTTPDIPSIKSVRLMLEVLDALDVAESKRKLIISQAGRRYGVKVEDVERSLAAKCCAALPYDDSGPLLAANQGRPLFEIDPEMPLCRAIMQLAKQVTGGVQCPEPEVVEQKPKSRGLLSLWGRS